VLVASVKFEGSGCAGIMKRRVHLPSSTCVTTHMDTQG